jgi:ketosteroid isomerase-like protein
MYQLLYRSILIMMLSFPLYANSKESDVIFFHQLFTEWTRAFNQKNLEKSCQLFSTSVIATYRGIPEKNYRDICDGFKTIFQSTNKQYHYTFKLHDVYRSGHLAAVRITWYLRVTSNNQLVEELEDEGLDVFEKDKSNHWKIVNYLAYQRS